MGPGGILSQGISLSGASPTPMDVLTSGFVYNLARSGLQSSIAQV